MRFSAESFNVVSPASSSVQIAALVSAVLAVGIAAWFAARVLPLGETSWG